MSPKGRAILGVALMLALAFAGCTRIAPGGKLGRPFEPIAAPVWKAGYAWTYDLTTSYHYSGFGADAFGDGPDGDSKRSTVTLTVFNTTAPLDGKPVYYVRADNEIDSNPLFEGTVWAYTQDQLEEVAYAWQSMSKGMMDVAVMPHPMYYDYPYQPEPRYDPCNGMDPLHRRDEAQRHTLYRFPLDDGQDYSGSMETESLLFDYTTRVNGLVDVKVPAGEYKAAYITTEFEPDLPPEAEEYGLTIHFRVENWYAPAVQYLVKTVVRAEGSIAGSRSGEGFQFSLNMELRDSVLTAGVEEPAPPVIDGEPTFEPAPSFAIGRTAGDPNIASGPVEFTFGLVPPSVKHMDSSGPVESTANFTAAELFDHGTHQLRWLVRSYSMHNYGSFEESFGDTLTRSFAEGGRWNIEATIVPLKCGSAELGGRSTMFSTYYEKQFNVSQDPGLGGTVEVGTFPVSLGSYQSFLTWSHKPAAGYGVNAGRPQITDPLGRTYGPSSSSVTSFEFYPNKDGLWSLQWRQDNPTLGDDATVTVRIAYDMDDYGGPVLH